MDVLSFRLNGDRSLIPAGRRGARNEHIDPIGLGFAGGDRYESSRALSGAPRDCPAVRRVLCRDQAIRIRSLGAVVSTCPGEGWKSAGRGSSRKLRCSRARSSRSRQGRRRSRVRCSAGTGVGTHNRLECDVLSSRRFQGDRCRCPRRIFWAYSDHLINDRLCSHVAEFLQQARWPPAASATRAR